MEGSVSGVSETSALPQLSRGCRGHQTHPGCSGCWPPTRLNLFLTAKAGDGGGSEDNNTRRRAQLWLQTSGVGGHLSRFLTSYRCLETHEVTHAIPALRRFLFQAGPGHGGRKGEGEAWLGVGWRLGGGIWAEQVRWPADQVGFDKVRKRGWGRSRRKRALGVQGGGRFAPLETAGTRLISVFRRFGGEYMTDENGWGSDQLLIAPNRLILYLRSVNANKEGHFWSSSISI